MSGPLWAMKPRPRHSKWDRSSKTPSGTIECARVTFTFEHRGTYPEAVDQAWEILAGFIGESISAWEMDLTIDKDTFAIDPREVAYQPWRITCAAAPR